MLPNTTPSILSNPEEEFSLVAELSTNREEYKGGQHVLRIPQVPSFVLYSIDLIQSDVTGAIGITPVIQCCIMRCLVELGSDPYVERFTRLRDKISALPDDIDEDWIEAAHGFITDLRLSIPNPTASALKAITIRVTDEVHTALYEVSTRLAIGSVSKLIILCVCWVLEEQATLSRRVKWRKGLERVVVAFRRRLMIHVELSERLLEIMKEDITQRTQKTKKTRKGKHKKRRKGSKGERDE